MQTRKANTVPASVVLYVFHGVNLLVDGFNLDLWGVKDNFVSPYRLILDPLWSKLTSKWDDSRLYREFPKHFRLHLYD